MGERGVRPGTSAVDHVLFLHIPKTAGMTLYSVLEREYPSERTFAIGSHAPEDVARLSALPLADRAAIRLVQGHMGYGIHESLPGASAYFTVLRDPVARVVSYYNYARFLPEHYLHEVIHGDDLTLVELLEARLPVMMDNGAVRLLSGVWGDVDFGGLTRDHLAGAKRHLDECAVVGLTERFDETLCLLAETFAWTASLGHAKTNVTPRTGGRAIADAATQAVVERHNLLDRELYGYGAALFEGQLRAGGPALTRRLAAHRGAQAARSFVPHALRARMAPMLSAIRRHRAIREE